MPSIMDLVREYSELEIRRSESGGMLEPHSEIRYQALKFFLEFDLFPMPVQKPSEIQRSYEKKKVVSSGEIKKPIEIKTQGETVVEGIVDRKKEEGVKTGIVSDKSAELVSIISETTLPVEDNLQPINSQVEEISQIEGAVIVETTPSHGHADVAPLEKREEEIAKDEDVLEMVDAIDGAVDSIIVADAPAQENSPQIPLKADITDIKEVPNPTVFQSDENKEEGLELFSQIDKSIENVIQVEEKVDNQAAVLENVLPDILEIKPEQSNIIIPDIPTAETVQPAKNLQEVVPLPDEIQQVPAINIEEILSLSQNTGEPVTETSTSLLNIEEVIATTEKIDNIVPQESTNPPTVPQIDFLSGLVLNSEQVIPSVQTETLKPQAQETRQIEEMMPTDILSETSTAIPSVQGRVFVDTPSKAAVHLIDGDARRGVIKELVDSQTEVELFEDETIQNSTKIPVAEIKAIFVMRHSGERPPSLSNGVKLNVRFKDDRSIFGISTDYSESTKIFTLVPADAGQSARLIIVYRGFVDSVEKI